MTTSSMHRVYIDFVKRAFHRNMELWGRGEPIPEGFKKLGPYVQRKDPVAYRKACEELIEETRGL